MGFSTNRAGGDRRATGWIEGQGAREEGPSLARRASEAPSRALRVREPSSARRAGVRLKGDFALAGVCTLELFSHPGCRYLCCRSACALTADMVSVAAGMVRAVRAGAGGSGTGDPPGSFPAALARSGGAGDASPARAADVLGAAVFGNSLPQLRDDHF